MTMTSNTCPNYLSLSEEVQPHLEFLNSPTLALHVLKIQTVYFTSHPITYPVSEHTVSPVQGVRVLLAY